MQKTLFTLAMLGILTALCLGLALPLLARPAASTEPADGMLPFTVVLDAGHGGEDGGAVGANGLQEKHVNLAVTLLIRDLLEANGIPVVLTRDTDVLLYDRSVDYQGRKKALDLQARQQIAEKTPNAVLVSIHMNAFGQKQYSGLQVWYSANDTRSATLAGAIQDTVRDRLQPDNARRIKQAESNIYLLSHVTVPAVLVECGFLSNPQEAALLKTDAYRQQLAQAVSLGIVAGLQKISAESLPRS